MENKIAIRKFEKMPDKKFEKIQDFFKEKEDKNLKYYSFKNCL